MMKRLTYIMILLAFAAGSQAQEGPGAYVSGEIILQAAPGTDARYLVSKAEARSGLSFPVELELLSGHMNAWRVRAGSEEEATDLMRLLQSDEEVVLVQRNHFLGHRGKLPNDSLFNLQWQYVNTGLSGGAPDADIDADDAWEITTGGVTPAGDTIVVAVVDDGLDLTHNDFGDNLWINYNEIPNNQVDDDGNGYVDDYRGWNAYDQNDDIGNGSWGGWHGTPVAGIVGAQGDNGRGVTGVNWNVKLMIVAGGGTTEAEAISAYSYVLECRKLYELSGGTKGAYVVATNSSWGLDFGQPSQAPLWCAFYDTLGAWGILSAAATANLSIDVDVDGDLPTACPSDYLIAVTNTNKQDQKVVQAGYGASSIDLGSPGADTYTVDHTLFSNGYGYFGGTSGATPHVAGAVALLYSAPCDTLASLARLYPDSVARLMKQFILAGTDSLPTLDTLTVSGGRLNLYKSLLRLQDYCDLLTSIGEVDAPHRDIKVMPNPVIDIARIALPPGERLMRLGVFDLAGRQQAQAGWSETPGGIRLDCSNLAPGIYILRLDLDGAVLSTRLVVAGN